MDTIGDMLTSIINSQRVGKQRLAVPYSRSKELLLAFLKEKGSIGDYRKQDGPQPKIVITLAYKDELPAIRGLKRISKPGSRTYVKAHEMPFNYAGIGMVVVSTSKGLMDERQARREGVGGELVCAIW